MNKVSIALCTFNGGMFLPEQIESFLKQTRLPDELVVCDDCSSDETIEIVENFAQTAPFPVRLHKNETNLGSTKNFEKAITLCAGDLIFLSDQDDVWLPQKIEKFAAEFAKSEQIGMVFSDAELVGERLETLGHNLWEFSFTPEERRKAQGEKMFEVLLRRNAVTGAATAFRSAWREVFLPIPTDIPNIIHDGWIALAIAANAEVRFLDERLILYRQHASQQLGIDWKYKEKIEKTTRRERYEKSIYFEREEQERLVKFPEVIKSYRCFQKKAKEIRIDDLIDSFREESEQRVRHLAARINLPAKRLQRVPPIISEFLTGRYGRFSKGLISATKDLFEKW